MNVILDSASHFTSIMIYFTLENELRKMTFDVIMTSYFRYGSSCGKIIVIFGFSVSNYVYLVTFGRKIKFSIFANFHALGLSRAKD